MGPKVELPGWKQKTVPSFGARLDKTQHTDCAGLSVFSVWFEDALFDRNGEPSDQLRDLVQLRRIAVLDSPRKPDETFIVAHGRYVARNDRRNRLS
jgi:hypothetical protein